MDPETLCGGIIGLLVVKQEQLSRLMQKMKQFLFANNKKQEQRAKKRLFSYLENKNQEQIKAEQRLRSYLDKKKKLQLKDELVALFNREYILSIDQLEKDFPGWQKFQLGCILQGDYVRLEFSEYVKIGGREKLGEVIYERDKETIPIYTKEKEFSLWNRYPELFVVIDVPNKSLVQISVPQMAKREESWYIPSAATTVAAYNGDISEAHIQEHLMFLDLRGNKVNRISCIIGSRYKHQIKYLGLAENRLDCLLDIEEFVSLQELNLSENYIHDKELHHLTSLINLRKLDLSYNPIQDITPVLGLFKYNLKSLYVQEDIVIPVKLKHLFSEKMIELSNLRVKEINSKGLTSEELKEMAQSSPSVVDKAGLTELAMSVDK